MYTFSTVEEAVADIKAGRIVMVTDDEQRENEMKKANALGVKICDDRKRKFYGNTWKRTDLYADGAGSYRKTDAATDGQSQYR